MKVLVVTLAGKPVATVPDFHHAEKARLAALAAGFWAKNVVANAQRRTSTVSMTMAGGNSMHLTERGGLLYVAIGRATAQMLHEVCRAAHAIVLSNVSSKLEMTMQYRPGLDPSNLINAGWFAHAVKSALTVPRVLNFLPLDAKLHVVASSLRDSAIKDGPQIISHILVFSPSGALCGAVGPTLTRITADDIIALTALVNSPTPNEKLYLPSYEGRACFYTKVTDLEEARIVMLTPRRAFADDLAGRDEMLRKRIRVQRSVIQKPILDGCTYLALANNNEKSIVEFQQTEDDIVVGMLVACKARSAERTILSDTAVGTVATVKLQGTPWQVLAAFDGACSADDVKAAIDSVILPWAETTRGQFSELDRIATIPPPGFTRFLSTLG